LCYTSEGLIRLSSQEELRKKLEDHIEKTIEKRFSFLLPDLTAGPVELNHALIAVQEILTEIEGHLSKAMRAKAALDRREAHLRMVWQEAFDRALTKPSKSFGSEFASGKEKAAEANLAAFDHARLLRTVQEDASFGTEAVEIIRLNYYVLYMFRQDVIKRLDMSQSDYYSS
jgi:hypothetical protein